MVQNGQISDFRGLLALTLTFDPSMVITFFSSLIEYYLYTKFHRNRRNILWTDGHTDGNLSPIVLGRLPKFGSRPKKQTNICNKVHYNTKINRGLVASYILQPGNGMGLFLSQ